MGNGFQGDHQKYRDSIREFVYGELEVLAEEMEETRQYPPSLWDKLRERDIFRLAVPEKYGGLGFSDSEYFPILEEISKSHGGIRLLVHGWNGICLHPLMHFG
ncbi:MAG: acyl-CoA dehydrogenase family protein, partial [Chloroflexi bacterium]|nr:acyl-CoA dehydrogenase family protein [Chloroflexota bacterium]